MVLFHKILPQHVLFNSIGNIFGEGKEHDLRTIVRNPAARSLRKKIVQEKCKCSYECAMTVNTLFSWPIAGSFWKRVLFGK